MQNSDTWKRMKGLRKKPMTSYGIRKSFHFHNFCMLAKVVRMFVNRKKSSQCTSKVWNHNEILRTRYFAFIWHVNSGNCQKKITCSFRTEQLSIREHISRSTINTKMFCLRNESVEDLQIWASIKDGHSGEGVSPDGALLTFTFQMKWSRCVQIPANSTLKLNKIICLYLSVLAFVFINCRQLKYVGISGGAWRHRNAV